MKNSDIKYKTSCDYDKLYDLVNYPQTEDLWASWAE